MKIFRLASESNELGITFGYNVANKVTTVNAVVKAENRNAYPSRPLKFAPRAASQKTTATAAPSKTQPR